jgi:hypothetical protein
MLTFVRAKWMKSKPAFFKTLTKYLTRYLTKGFITKTLGFMKFFCSAQTLHIPSPLYNQLKICGSFMITNLYA